VKRILLLVSLLSLSISFCSYLLSPSILLLFSTYLTCASCFFLLLLLSPLLSPLLPPFFPALLFHFSPPPCLDKREGKEEERKPHDRWKPRPAPLIHSKYAKLLSACLHSAASPTSYLVPITYLCVILCTVFVLPHSVLDTLTLYYTITPYPA